MTRANCNPPLPRPHGWRNWLAEILLGEDSRQSRHAPAHGSLRGVFKANDGGWRWLAVAEDGMVSWATLFTVLFFAIFAQMIVNVSTAVHEKIETQNAADATAASGAVWMARSMNGMTAANHMMGELTALYTLHHALGAEHLDEKPNTPNNSGPIMAANVALDLAYYNVAYFPKTIPVFQTHYDTVKKNPAASQESTLYMSKLVLKIQLAAAYGVHYAGAWLEKFPWTAAAGIAMQAGALATQIKIWVEFKILNALESVAKSLRTIKRKVIPALLKAVWGYEKSVVVGGPVAAHTAAEQIAKRHGMEGELTGEVSNLSFVRLPLEKETTGSVSRSQLMRATYPWVHQWRKPLVATLTVLCTLSLASSFYVHYTDVYSYEIVEEFRDDKGYKLYVMKGLDVPDVDKSQESWATVDGSAEAEKLFCYMAYARKEKPPTVYAPAIFRQWNPGGSVAFSQSMIYNANPQQEPAASNGSTQPVAGWDTLNWKPGSHVVEYKAPQQGFGPLGDIFGGVNSLSGFLGVFDTFDEIGGSFKGGKAPAVLLNWQAKLTPVTMRKLRVTIARDATIRKVMLKRATPLSPATRRFLTH